MRTATGDRFGPPCDIFPLDGEDGHVIEGNVFHSSRCFWMLIQVKPCRAIVELHHEGHSVLIGVMLRQSFGKEAARERERWREGVCERERERERAIRGDITQLRPGSIKAVKQEDGQRR